MTPYWQKFFGRKAEPPAEIAALLATGAAWDLSTAAEPRPSFGLYRLVGDGVPDDVRLWTWVEGHGEPLVEGRRFLLTWHRTQGAGTQAWRNPVATDDVAEAVELYQRWCADAGLEPRLDEDLDGNVAS